MQKSMLNNILKFPKKIFGAKPGADAFSFFRICLPLTYECIVSNLLLFACFNSNEDSGVETYIHLNVIVDLQCTNSTYTTTRPK